MMPRRTAQQRIERAKACETLRAQGLNYRQISLELGLSMATVSRALLDYDTYRTENNLVAQRFVRLELRDPVADWVKANLHLAERALEVAYRVRERLHNTTTDPKLEKYSKKGKKTK